MPKDQIIQFNDKLYYGNNISVIPNLSDTKDVFVLNTKQVTNVNELEIFDNAYTTPKIQIPQGYELYHGLIGTSFVGTCIAATGVTAVGRRDIMFGSNISSTIYAPDRNTATPFDLSMSNTSTIIREFNSANVKLYNGWYLDTEYGYSSIALPNSIYTSIQYRGGSNTYSITVTGTIIIELIMLLYKIA